MAHATMVKKIGEQRAYQYDIYLQIDPLTQAGKTWKTQFQAKLEQVQKTSQEYEFYLYGDPGTEIDAVDKVYDLFPTVVGITVAIVVLVLCAAFRSAVVPMRAVLTLTAMLAFVYGLATLVYVKGQWDGPLTPVQLEGTDGGLSWFGPVMCFSILVGLGLDYDILMVDRVLEERKGGKAPIESIKIAYETTAPVALAAGIIMIVAFSGLMASNQPNLNQIAFYLLFGVAWDTMINECMVVPACMAALKGKNWWPTKFKSKKRVRMETQSLVTKAPVRSLHLQF